MPLTAVRHVRKMRGGAQAHLLEADDGCWYVVKFRNNPQHPRILVNELLSSVLLGYLKIAAPETALIQVTARNSWPANPEIHFTLGDRARRPSNRAGISARAIPAIPRAIAVYDFLPDALLRQWSTWRISAPSWSSTNGWATPMAASLSLSRRGARKAGAPPARRPGFVARMIDHGFAFNGPHWELTDSPLQGLYARRLVYESVRSLDDFQPWLEQVVHFPEEVIDRRRGKMRRS